MVLILIIVFIILISGFLSGASKRRAIKGEIERIKEEMPKTEEKIKILHAEFKKALTEGR